MKRSVIEQKLNDAMSRRASAQANEWHLTSEIKYHDQRVSEIRKDRQKVRNKKDRAEAAIVRLSAMLQQAV
jgi:hypothetical protein